MSKSNELKLGVILFIILGIVIFGGAYLMNRGVRYAAHDELPAEQLQIMKLVGFSQHYKKSIAESITTLADDGLISRTNPDLKNIDFSKPNSDLDTVSSFIHEIANNPKIILTLANRIKGAGTERPDLILVVTNIKPDICKSLHDKTYSSKQPLQPISKINTASYKVEVNEDEIVTLENHIDCVSINNEYYFYNLLLEQ